MIYHAVLIFVSTLCVTNAFRIFLPVPSIGYHDCFSPCRKPYCQNDAEKPVFVDHASGYSVLWPDAHRGVDQPPVGGHVRRRSVGDDEHLWRTALRGAGVCRSLHDGACSPAHRLTGSPLTFEPILKTASMAEWLTAWDTLATIKLWKREVMSLSPDRGTIVRWVYTL